MKVCLKCLVEKPKSDFRAASSNTDGRNHFCKACATTYSKPELKLLGMRICPCCKLNLNRAVDFARNKFGPLSFCKKCAVRYMNEKYANDTVYKDKKRQNSVLYRKNNPEKIKKIRSTPKHISDLKKGALAFSARLNERMNQDKIFKKQYLEKKKNSDIKAKRNKVDQMSDAYILGLLTIDFKMKVSEIRAIPNISEVIQAKRAIIQLVRAARK